MFVFTNIGHYYTNNVIIMKIISNDIPFRSACVNEHYIYYSKGECSSGTVCSVLPSPRAKCDVLHRQNGRPKQGCDSDLTWGRVSRIA